MGLGARDQVGPCARGAGRKRGGGPSCPGTSRRQDRAGSALPGTRAPRPSWLPRKRAQLPPGRGGGAAWRRRGAGAGGGGRPGRESPPPPSSRRCCPWRCPGPGCCGGPGRPPPPPSRCGPAPCAAGKVRPPPRAYALLMRSPLLPGAWLTWPSAGLPLQPLRLPARPSCCCAAGSRSDLLRVGHPWHGLFLWAELTLVVISTLASLLVKALRALIGLKTLTGSLVFCLIFLPFNQA